MSTPATPPDIAIPGPKPAESVRTTDAGAAVVAPARPAPGAPRPYHFPSFERRALPNGLSLLVAPVHKLPVVTVVAVVDAGAVCDPAAKEGVAQLTARAMLEGAAGVGGAELVERFERLGTALDASADWDGAIFRLNVMSSRLQEALSLFGGVLTTPDFPEGEVERLRAERLAEILQQRAEPRGLADEMLDRFVYAEESRYAKPEGGSEASVKGLTRGDLQRFYMERYAPASTTLVVAGDVTTDDAERLAAEALGGWTGPQPPRVAAVDRAARPVRAVHVVSKADAPQSELRVGQVGLPRLHPDFFPAVVMNALLGGLFSSRINLNLREAHAYTYGAHSEFAWRRQAGPWLVATAVKSDVTADAAREVMHEIDRVRGEPVSADELSLATSYLDGVFPIRYETAGAIAAALANLVIYGLPEDYFDRYRERVRSVTAEQVQAAARQYLSPEAMQLVIVGDPAVVRPAMEALGVGPVSVYDVDGKAV